MPDDLPPISSSRVPATEVSRHSFATVRRGFDPQEVRSFLELVARELAAWEQHDQELRGQLAEAEERSRNPVIDESALTAALGQHSAQVLRNAHEEAARITLQAEEAAALLVREAQSHAAEILVQAESGAAERIAEAEIEAGGVHEQARRNAAQVVEAAQAEGEALAVRAHQRGLALIEQAQESRRRVLADLVQRRRAMTVQIEQFRAARDELAASVLGVRDSVDNIVGDLGRADDQARAAAADVARHPPAEVPLDELVGEGESAQAILAAVAAAAADDPDAGADGPTEVGPLDQDALVVEVAEPVDTGDDAVEGLFARLRAGHSAAGSPEGNQPAAETPPVEEDPPPAGVAEPAATAPTKPAVGGDTAPAAADGGAAEGPADDDPTAGPDESGETDPDEPVRARRAELLDPIVTRLARRVKRALQDDQNRLLERLRNTSGAWTDEVLVPEDEQRALYVEAATAILRDAVAAGATFSRGRRTRGRGKAPAPDEKMVAEAAEGLAGTVVALLRRRLVDQDSEDADAADRVGAAYREWRGERIERLVGDSALGAFSSGVLAATGREAGLRWVVGGSGPACADCDDNALAGTVATGEEFPTGHRHPPAHAGCRCLVVPTPA